MLSVTGATDLRFGPGLWYQCRMEEADYTFAQMREQMVLNQLEGRGIVDTAVLDAFRTVPRELFVPRKHRRFAYDDTPLPILRGQTISQPYVVAYMISLLRLRSSETVLEIGTGSGYAAAILSRIVTAVYSVERYPELIGYAQKRLAQTGYENVHLRGGDGTLGWAAHAPYDGIIVAAGGPIVPPSLKKQLAVGGRMIIPVGRHQRQQRLVLLERRSETVFDEHNRSPVAFVPLIGEEGWEK